MWGYWRLKVKGSIYILDKRGKYVNIGCLYFRQDRKYVNIEY